MKVCDIMTPEPETVTPSDPIERAAQLMRTYDVGIIPVVDNQTSCRLVGVITDRDIAVRHVADAHNGTCTVGSHMTASNLETVCDEDDSEKVLTAMKRRELRRIPVTDRSGKLVGVIAQADIALSEAVSEEDVAEVVRCVSEPGAPAR